MKKRFKTKMRLFLIVFLGKIVATLSRLFNIGVGGTWPGEIGLLLDKDLIKKLIVSVEKGVILVAGTNGKTTTAKMIKTVLKKDSRTVKIIQNQSGANLLNGIASALIEAAGFFSRTKVDWAVFEVDEAILSLALKEFSPKIVVCLNLFRDQLDRYGEIDLIAEKWHQALKKLPNETTVILNADDPQVAALGKNLKAKVLYFGLEEPRLFLTKIPHAADSLYCLSCGERLKFEGVYFSHLGIWRCEACGEKRPKVTLSVWDWPLSGVYNRYNTLAAVLVGKALEINEDKIKAGLENFRPPFGRGEEFEIQGKTVRILLSKNPAGFNVTLRRLTKSQRQIVLLALNDRVPDGRDVSWIWDVDFEDLLPNCGKIICTGDRAYDLALRIKYATEMKNEKLKTKNDNVKLKIFENPTAAVKYGLKIVNKGEMFSILPTYSAMLEIRKILKGRRIL